MNKATATYAAPSLTITRWVKRDWQRPSDGRYYQAQLQQDLFKNWIVVRRWGTIHSRRGRTLETTCATYEAAVSELMGLEKRRAQRGYVPTH